MNLQDIKYILNVKLLAAQHYLFVTRFDLSLLVFFKIMFIFQFVVSVFVLRMFLCETRSTKFIVAAGLAQVSEFSFVLGSRARRFHLISREVRFKECTDNGCVWRIVSNLLSKTESKANKDMKKNTGKRSGKLWRKYWFWFSILIG